MSHFTLKRNAFAQEALRVQAEEVSDWIKGTLKDDYNVNLKQGDQLVSSFMESIQSGVVLCKILQKCTKSEIQFDVNAQPESFRARDNIAKFISGCEKSGMSQVSLFTTEDLIGRKNDKQVLSCLLQVSKLGAKNGVAPPQIVQYELDLEEKEKEEATLAEQKGSSGEAVEHAGAEEEEEYSPEMFNLSEPEFQAISAKFETLKDKNNTASQSKLISALLEDNKVSELMKSRPVLALQLKALAADDDANLNLGDFLKHLKSKQEDVEKKAAETEAAAAESKLESKVEAPTKEVAKKEKKKPNYLPYVAKKGDEIDHALAEVVNGHRINVRIFKMKAKPGRKVRSVNGGYLIGERRSKADFRIVRGLLMVRVGKDWGDVVHYLQRKADEVAPEDK